MKKFAFVSDFDNTISKKDFYHIIIDKYLGEKGRALYNDWKKTRKIGVEFLNKVFASVSLSEEEIKKEAIAIPMDMTAINFMKKIKDSKNDFYIVSAGTSYYINILLDNLGIKDASIISMKGMYENGILQIKPDKNSPYYSEVFGLDKGKFVQSIKNDYKKIYYAGDSEPDLTAAKAADIRFAKGQLAQLLEREGIEFIRFDEFSEIENYMKNEM